MPMLPLDLQANYGNLDLVVKEVNKVQNLSQDINYNSAVTLEKFSKEIYSKIIETEETPEQQKIKNRKKEEERKKEKKRKKGYAMSEEELKKRLNKQKMEQYKGKYVNLYK
ncbi:MAG: hypothetical protein ACOCV8_05485 [Spirochaetota bacterium]